MGLKLESLNKVVVCASRGARMGMAAKAKAQRQMAYLGLRGNFGKPPAPPLSITITRIGPRELDWHDNLPASCKHIADGICDFLGVNDRSRLLTWNFDQQKQGRGVYGVKIGISRSCVYHEPISVTAFDKALADAHEELSKALLGKEFLP